MAASGKVPDGKAAANITKKLLNAIVTPFVKIYNIFLVGTVHKKYQQFAQKGGVAYNICHAV